MKVEVKTRFLGVILAAFAMGSCKDTSFSSSGGAKRPSADAKKDAGSPDGDGKDKPDDGTRPGTSTVKDTGGLGTDTNTAGGSSGTTDQCLAKKADDYNILLIFDTSASQEQTDPGNVRREGATAFVDRFNAYVQTNNKARVFMAVLSFNDASIRGAQGWTRLTGSNADAVKSDINSATATPQGGTAYSPVLKDAAQFYRQINAATDKDRVRNYVVFLTDGLPNAAEGAGFGFPGFPGDVETMADIPPAVDNLVKNYGVAMIAIASGPGIPPEGESVVQSLAQPKVGLKNKNHVGIYRRAQTADDLKAVFDQLLNDIGTCN